MYYGPEDPYQNIKSPFKRGAKLSVFGLVAVFGLNLLIQWGRISSKSSISDYSGIIYVCIGALVVIPALCFSYSYIAFSKGDKKAQQIFIAPLALAFAIGLVIWLYVSIYVYGDLASG